MYRIRFQYYNRHLRRAVETVDTFDSLDAARRRAHDNQWTIVECVQVATAPAELLLPAADTLIARGDAR